MKKGQLKRKNSTSPEEEPAKTITQGRTLTFDQIGTEVTVRGRDITLSHHNLMAKQITGVLYSLRMTADRVVVTLDVQHNRLKFRSPRVVEVEL